MMPIEFQPYERLERYPHLAPADVRIWDKFIEDNPIAFEQVAYGVKVGFGQPAPPDLPPELLRDWLILTQSKIDIIAKTPSRDYIIEVKPSAAYSAVGQLLAYKSLSRLTIPELLEPSLMVITDFLKEDPRIVFNDLDIQIRTVTL